MQNRKPDVDYEKSTSLRRKLVAELRKEGSLTQAKVAQAFLEVPRELFVPKTLKEKGLEAVYANDLLMLKQDEFGSPISSSSQPGIMAAMLEALEIQPGAKILEIGAGSGYNAALLETIAGAKGRVTSIEIEPDLVVDARRFLRSGGYKTKVVLGDGRKGWRDGSPYDRIIATASSTDLPLAWFRQLRKGGLLQFPLRLHAGLHWPQLGLVLKAQTKSLELVRAMPSAFMQLRPAVGSPSREQSTNVYVGASRRGNQIPFVYLQGLAIDRLSSGRLRQVGSIAALKPQMRRLTKPIPRNDFEAFMCLAAKTEKLVSLVRANSGGVAVLDGELSSMAALGGGKNHFSRIEVSGGKRAEHSLRRMIFEWEALGRPRLEDLRVRVSFTRPSRAWRVRRAGESYFAFHWF